MHVANCTIRMWLLQIHSATRGLDVSGRILGEEVTRFFGAAAGRHRLLCKRGIGAYACTYIWAFIIHVLSTVAHVALRIGRLQAGYISTVLFCRYDSLRWYREGGCDADDLVCRKLDWGGWDRVAA